MHEHVIRDASDAFAAQKYALPYDKEGIAVTSQNLLSALNIQNQIQKEGAVVYAAATCLLNHVFDFAPESLIMLRDYARTQIQKIDDDFGKVVFSYVLWRYARTEVTAATLQAARRLRASTDIYRSQRFFADLIITTISDDEEEVLEIIDSAYERKAYPGHVSLMNCLSHSMQLPHSAIEKRMVHALEGIKKTCAPVGTAASFSQRHVRILYEMLVEEWDIEKRQEISEKICSSMDHLENLEGDIANQKALACLHMTLLQLYEKEDIAAAEEYLNKSHEYFMNSTLHPTFFEREWNQVRDFVEEEKNS